MAVLAQTDRDAIKSLFAGAHQAVTALILEAGEGAETRPGTGMLAEFKEVLGEVCELAPVVRVEVRDWQEGGEALGERAPAVVLLDAAGKPLRVRFSGYPVGYEFGAFVQDLADAARGVTSLSAATLDALGALAEPVRIKVFTTPT